MEEMYRTHKEPAWGWVGVILPELKRLRDRAARFVPEKGYVVTPWSPRSRPDWSA